MAPAAATATATATNMPGRRRNDPLHDPEDDGPTQHYQLRLEEEDDPADAEPDERSITERLVDGLIEGTYDPAE